MKYTLTSIPKYLDKLKNKIYLTEFESLLLMVNKGKIKSILNDDTMEYLYAYIVNKNKIEITFYYKKFFIKLNIWKDKYKYKISAPYNIIVENKFTTKVKNKNQFDNYLLLMIISNIKDNIDSVNYMCSLDNKNINRLLIKYILNTIKNFITKKIVSIITTIILIFILFFVQINYALTCILIVSICILTVFHIIDIIRLGITLFNCLRDIVTNKVEVFTGIMTYYENYNYSVFRVKGNVSNTAIYVTKNDNYIRLMPYCSNFFSFMPLNSTTNANNLLDSQKEHDFVFCKYSKLCIDFDLKFLNNIYKHKEFKNCNPNYLYSIICHFQSLI